MKFRHVLLCTVAVVVSTFAVAQNVQRPYPEGRRFPLGLYQITTAEDMSKVGAAGWFVGMNWGTNRDWIDAAEQAGWMAYAPVHAKTEADAQAEIAPLAAHDSIVWWDLPEDALWKGPEEAEVAENLFNWTRRFDPQQRPNAIWIPDYFTESQIGQHAAYIDLFITGVYPEWAHQPRAWARWRMETVISGLEKAGYTIGRDWKAGQKTPMATLMMFNKGVDQYDLVVPAEAYHDFWASIASGAKGIMVMSHAHKKDAATFEKTWELGYNRAATNLLSDGKLDQTILFGEDVPLQVEVTEGMPLTVSFRPEGYDADFRLPAVKVMGKSYHGTLYVIAVCSQERGVSARISGLPAGVDSLEVLFEDRPGSVGGNTLAVTGGAFEDTFGWLGVHIYRCALNGA